MVTPLAMNGPEILLLLVFLLALLGTGFWLERRLVRGEGAVSGRPTSRSGFGWLAVLVVLPVVVLAGVGLFSLRQDRALAEQQARESARALAEQLAHDGSQAIQTAHFAYDTAASELRAELEAGLGLVRVGADQLQTIRERRESWQQAHPDCPLGLQPFSRCAVDFNGEPFDPRGSAASPAPAGWLEQLTADQLRLWQTAQTACVSGSAEEADAAWQQFLALDPPAEAKDTAEFLQLSARIGPAVPQALVTNLLTFAAAHREAVADSGLPLRQLAVLQALRILPARENLPKPLRDLLRDAVLDPPTVLSPRILQEAERRARSDTVPGTNVSRFFRGWSESQQLWRLRTYWDALERTRRTLEALALRPAATGRSNGVCWFAVPNGQRFVAVVYPEPQRTAVPSTGLETDPRTPAFRINLFPARVVLDAVSNVCAAAAIPPYALVTIQFGDERCVPAGDASADVRREASLPLLAEATRPVSILPSPVNAAMPTLTVRLSLANPPLLYARQRQRLWLFGALILVAAATALVGLVAAQRAFQRQLRLNELKSNFVSSVSHELRAPIAAVRLLAESLERGRVRDEARRHDYFRLIGQECRRLSGLIENVLDFSRIDQGRKRYEFEPTDLPALVEQTVRLMEPYAAERQVRLELVRTLRDDLSSPTLDGRAVQQALVNLIDNAVKHAPAGSSVTVELSAHLRGQALREGSPPHAAGAPHAVAAEASQSARSDTSPQAAYLVLSVTDRGPGIPREEHDRIFEPFYRRGSELRRETPGVGIGLSIVKHVVEGHAGRVRVESAPGQGSRFVMELPLHSGDITPFAT